MNEENNKPVTLAPSDATVLTPFPSTYNDVMDKIHEIVKEFKETKLEKEIMSLRLETASMRHDLELYWAYLKTHKHQ